MMPILRLAFASLANRRTTAVLTIAAISLGVILLLGVERIRTEARQGFANTVSGVDLIVGARGGSMQLLLYSVFRIGNATSEMSWAVYEKIAADPKVAWSIPLALGDSHKGFRVLGTSDDYFRHFRHGRKRKLEFDAGAEFSDIFDAVLGADVAAKLAYKVGDTFTITHGIGDAASAEHRDKPFRVSGILAKTGTPVDNTIHVGLDGIEAVHIDWRGGARVPGLRITSDEVRSMNLRPNTVTAVLIGLKSRRAAFKMLRQLNGYAREPLTAVLPGVVLHELWRAVGTAERILSAVTLLVVLTSLLGMSAMLLAGIEGRRREMAILRSVGAGPRHVLALLLLEASALTLSGILCGLALLYGALAIGRPIVEAHIGTHISMDLPGHSELGLIGLVLVAGLFAGTLSSLYFYAYAVMQLPVGAMVDRWGPGLPYAGALILAALGSSLFAVAESIETAYAGRILIGVGSAFGWVAALKIIAERFPPDRFAMMSGAGMFIGLCGGFSGQVIAGSLVDAFGWRITMWGAAIAGLLLSVAVYAFIGRRPAESAVDAPTMREILFGFAVALRNHKVWLVTGGGAIAAAPIFIFGSLWGVPYLMQVHGLERNVAASLTATILAGWGFGAFLSGWMSDRIGARRKPVVFGLVVALISLTTAIYGPKLPVLALGGLLLLAGLGSGVVVLSYAMAGDLSIAATRGSAYAFANMLMILSGAIFQPVAGWLLDLNWSGSTSNGARIYDAAAYEITFLMVPVTYVAGLVMILLSRYNEPSKSRNLSPTV